MLFIIWNRITRLEATNDNVFSGSIMIRGGALE